MSRPISPPDDASGHDSNAAGDPPCAPAAAAPVARPRLAPQLTQLLSTTLLTPAEALAADVLSPAELAFVSRCLPESQEKATLAYVPPGETSIDVTVRFRGTLNKGAPTTKRGTSRALRKATLAMLLEAIEREDVRQAVIRELGRILREAHAMTQDAEAKLLERYPEVEDAFAEVDQLLNQLPRIHSSGSASAKDVRLLFCGRTGGQP